MKFIDAYGKQRNLKNAKKYLIDWNKPSRSKFQTRVKKFLHPYWKNDIVFEEFRVVGSRLTLDFYNANKKIAIEVQGAQHRRYTPFFHGGNKYNYINQLRRDQNKLKFCEINNIHLVEIYNLKELTPSFFKKLGILL